MSHPQPRTPCVIDGCQRTTAKAYAEWICPKHWAHLTTAERRVWARMRRRERLRPESINPARYLRAWAALRRRATP
jgi:hypothetical protein